MDNLLAPIIVAVITGVVAPIVVQYFHRRKVVREARIRGDASVVTASIKSWDDLVANYATLVKELRGELRKSVV